MQQTWERDVLNPAKDVMVLYEAAVGREGGDGRVAMQGVHPGGAVLLLVRGGL